MMVDCKNWRYSIVILSNHDFFTTSCLDEITQECYAKDIKITKNIKDIDIEITKVSVV